MSQQQPCLPVPLVSTTKRKRDDNMNDPSSIVFEHHVNEMNAAEYLQRVAQQARSISDDTLIATPSVVAHRKSSSSLLRQPMIVDGSAASMHYLLSHHTQIAPPSIHIRRQPHDEAAWIQQTLDTFTQLRDYLFSCQHDHGVGGKEHRLLAAVPPMKDAAGWIEFCTGIQLLESEDDVEQHPDKNKSSNSAPSWREILPTEGYHAPTVQLLCQLDQVMIRRVLAHLTGAITTTTTTTATHQQLYMWLYALLARLETPVHGQDAATLRKLVIAVAARRARETNHDDSTATMNLVLVVAGLYFGQASRAELFP